MEAVVYSIADWPEHFENNRTKELRAMSWVPIPNKQDGDGYTELLDHPNGAAHFGAWVALIQVASKCDPRGTLLRDERSGVRRPHDAASLGRITRIPAAVFSEVLPRLLAIGWLIATPCTPTVYADPAVPPQEGAVIPHLPAPSCAHAEGKGMEGKYTEEKKNAGANKAAPLPLPQDFVRFWSAYPNPVAKGAALKAWEKTKRDRPPIDVLLEAVRRYAGSPKVREGFVANPATWLNQQRWLDAPPGSRPATNGANIEQVRLTKMQALASQRTDRGDEYDRDIARLQSAKTIPELEAIPL